MLCQANGSLPLNKTVYTLRVPHLTGGTYALRLQLKSATAVVGSAAVNFTRKARPWEGNDLGKDDRVIPPFTPITLSRDDGLLRLGVVGRDLLLGGGLGLWQQVHVTPVATPRNPRPSPLPILGGEVSLVAQVGGAAKPAVATRALAVTKATP